MAGALDDAAPGRPAAAAAGQPRGHREGDLRLVVGLAAAPDPARAQPQHAPGSRRNIQRALRPGQRVLRAVARRDDELLERLVRRRPHAAARAGAGRQAAPRHRRHRRAARPAPAGDRLRLGRGGRERGARGHRRRRPDAVHRAARVGAGAPRNARAWPQRADLRLQDYRDVPDGPFDAIVSIEMFEAVGREYWDAYFQTVHRQLKPRRQGLHPGHRDPRRPVRTLRPLDRLHPALRVPRRHAAQHCAVRAHAARRGPARGRTLRVRPRLRRDAAPLAPRVPRAPGRGARARASTSASCACGSSISRTAKRPSTRATPTSSSSRCSGTERAVRAALDRRSGSFRARGSRMAEHARHPSRREYSPVFRVWGGWSNRWAGRIMDSCQRLDVDSKGRHGRPGFPRPGHVSQLSLERRH